MQVVSPIESIWTGLLKPPGGDSMNRYLLRASMAAVSIALIAIPALAQSSDQTVEEGAGILAWIIVGLIGGFLASKVVNKTGQGTLRDILLGIVGGIVGGAVFRALGSHGVTGFNLWSILVAFIGGIVVLVLYHAIVGSRRSPV
jgi:uncharacterized membrane protein YeaQ/YmgE (transglycosylase-associated protein family)